MSQASTIFRANSSSGFYSSVKSRKSAGVSGCKILYNSEINNCPACRSTIETFSSNVPAYGSKVVFELPNFGHLSEAFLKVVFAKSTGSGATNRNGLTENAGVHLCSTIKLVSDGVEICRTTPEAMLCHFYKNSSNEKRRHYQQLVGGFKNRSLKTAFPTTANKDSALFPEARALAGTQTFFIPLNFFFSALDEQMNRALPLGVLERVFIECDTNDAGYVGYALGNVSYLPISSMSIISFLTELESSEEAMYRNSSFTDQPLSILAKNYLQHIEMGISHTAGTDTEHKINLNMFSGQISKLYIVCHDEANSAQQDSSSVDLPTKCHFVPELLKSISLEANGVVIQKIEKLTENEKYLEDWINQNYTTTNSMGTAQNGNHMAGDITSQGASWSSTLVDTTGDGNTATNLNSITYTSANTSSIDPSAIYVMSFKNVGTDQRDSSMTGSINFSNLSAPKLVVKINGTTDNGYGGLNGATGTKKIIVVAVQHTLVSYTTSNAGRVSFRSIA